MITKCQQPDGLWRYACDACGVVRVVRFADLKNPCRCPIQAIAEVECEDDPQGESQERAVARKAAVAAKANRPGLGDRVESALHSVGVTKERWAAFKGAMGLPATCNCEARQQYLNKLGDELGEAAKSAVASLFGKGKALPPAPPGE